MSRKYKFRDNRKLYFVSFAVVYWIDVFIRNEYRQVLLDSMTYCIENKGLEVYCWCIMTNHVHLIIGSHDKPLPGIMRDLKSNSSRELRTAIQDNPQEGRKEWMLWLMKRAGMKNNNNRDFQFWQQHNQPIMLLSNKMVDQKVNYIHNNPVKAGFVINPEDYLYSSAMDFAGEKGPLILNVL